MTKKLFIIAILFLVVRGITSFAYKDTYYYYGMISNQFAIADAAYRGHWFAVDTGRADAVSKANGASKDGPRFIPIEEWKNYPRSNTYVTFPAQDVPGFGYIISFTSKYLSHELTTRYAFVLQIMLELASLLIFIYCVYLILGERVAFISGLLYVFAYPFIWPIASLPMRDIFVVSVYAFYIGAFFIFSRRSDALSYLLVFLLVALASLILWVRPSAYYFFFVIVPFIFFLKEKSVQSRVIFALATILVPLIVYGHAFADFNLRYYGMADTDLLGRTLWEGMGIVKDNPYGFALDDGALVPWCKSRGYNVKMSSPEMNKVLGDYSRKIIRQHPGFYVKTVLVRGMTIIKRPLEIFQPKMLGLTSYTESGLSLKDFIKRYPIDFAIKIFFDAVAGFIFFNVGLILAIIMIYRLKDSWVPLIVLLMPLPYTLMTQIPLHFEPRYLSTGAWVLVLPFAWYVNRFLEKRRKTNICAA